MPLLVPAWVCDTDTSSPVAELTAPNFPALGSWCSTRLVRPVPGSPTPARLTWHRSRSVRWCAGGSCGCRSCTPGQRAALRIGRVPGSTSLGPGRFLQGRVGWLRGTGAALPSKAKQQPAEAPAPSLLPPVGDGWGTYWQCRRGPAGWVIVTHTGHDPQEGRAPNSGWTCRGGGSVLAEGLAPLGYL